MFLLARPSETAIDDFIHSLPHSTFSYPDVGATAGDIPRGYNCDRNRIALGTGDGVWNGAVDALRTWMMFDLGWTEIFPPSAPIATGTNVAIIIRHLGFYSLNSARIVYLIDEPNRFGFAYGTLRDHGESGEERFLIERDPSGAVLYDLLAFSRPVHPLARLGYPISRSLQKRFVKDSKLRMARAVTESIGRI
jgi:uncharacterized protein (UPF0548 family)